MRPNVSMTARVMRSMLPRSPMSAPRAALRRPFALTSPAVACAALASMSTTATSAPAWASASAMALPMPFPPPVTTAIRSARLTAARSLALAGRLSGSMPRRGEVATEEETRMSGERSVIERLAAYVSTESFGRLPEATVDAARRAVLDTLGVMLAGSREETAVRARAVIAHRRGSEEAVVAGTALRASIEDAALANGIAAHALDYDDLNASLSGHPSVPVLPAALALAERERASGQALLTAFVVGVEIEAKLGRALNPAHYESGWHATSALGIFGAAAAAAKLLGLTPDHTAHGLAIAASMARGIKANFGTDCKPLHVGHAARCGIEAALLARAGFTGNPRALEHGNGFGSTYGGGGKPAWELTTANLGTPHELVDPGVGVKRFP